MNGISLMEPRQRSWIAAAIAYHKAKVEIYKLMVEEWQEELAEIARARDDQPTEQQVKE